MRINKKNIIPLVISTDDIYAIYAPILLQSIHQTSSPNYQYHVYILDSGISEINKFLIDEFSNSHDNFKISFIDVNKFIEQYKDIFVTFAHFTPATYVRFFISEILPDYQKILYLDIDLLVKSDLSELYNINMDEYIVAAAIDACYARQLYFNENELKQYSENILKLPSGVPEFNAGVLLINLDNWDKNNITIKCINKLKEIGVPRVLDQCVLNSVIAQEKIYNLPIEWNYVWHADINNLDSITDSEKFNELINDYKNKQDKIKIVHYTSPIKPWNLYIQDKSSLETIIPKLAIDWWELAVCSNMYNQILIQCSIQYYKKVKPSKLIENNDNQLKINKTYKVIYKFLGIPIFKKIISDRTKKYYFIGIPIIRVKTCI